MVLSLPIISRHFFLLGIIKNFSKLFYFIESYYT
jgi:hypothetical protein